MPVELRHFLLNVHVAGRVLVLRQSQSMKSGRSKAGDAHCQKLKLELLEELWTQADFRGVIWREDWELPSPVPKSEGPWAPSLWFGKD